MQTLPHQKVRKKLALASVQANHGDKYKMENETTYGVMNEWIKQHESRDMMMGKVQGRPHCVPPTMTDRNWKDTKQLHSFPCDPKAEGDGYNLAYRRVYPEYPIKKSYRCPNSSRNQFHQGRMGANWHNIKDVLSHTGSHVMSIDGFAGLKDALLKTKQIYMSQGQCVCQDSCCCKKNMEDEDDTISVIVRPSYSDGVVETCGKYSAAVLPRVNQSRGRVGGNWDHVKEVLCQDGKRIVYMGVPGMEDVIQQNLKAREKVMVACPLLPAHRARPAKDNKNCSHAPIQELVISSPSQRSTSPPRSSLDIGARHLLPPRTGRSAKANKNSSHAPIQELVLPSPSETNTTPPYISFKEMMTRSHCKTNTDNSVRVGKIETPYRTCFTNKCPWR